MSVIGVVCERFFPETVMLRLDVPSEQLEPMLSVMFDTPPEGVAMVAGWKVADTQSGIPVTLRSSVSASPG